MSSDIPNTPTDTAAAHTESKESTPTLTVVATGPGTFTRQVSDDEEASILAEHETVALSFEAVLDPTFKGGGPTVSEAVVIDSLLTDHAMDGYQRAGSTGDWSLELTGTATDWKQLSLNLVPDLHRCDTDEAAAVTRLWRLAADGVTNDGAVLAALDLVDQHEIDTKRERLTELLAGG